MINLDEQNILDNLGIIDAHKNDKEFIDTEDIRFDIETSVLNFVECVKLGTTFEERKMILMMCYVNDVTLDELLRWSLDEVANYIATTDDYYENDKYIFEECYRLIREGNKNE